MATDNLPIINDCRPYEPLGMTSADWRAISLADVPLCRINYSQSHLYAEGIMKVMRGEVSYSGDIYPHLVEYQGKIWIVDGHHRVTVALVRGENTIKARLKKSIQEARLA